MGVDAVVVGAGFAGLYQLLRFRELGLTTRVFDAADDVGGTWYWNRYPGARCDVESMSYSYSFSPELEQEWTWTERYSGQPEILSYLNHVADRFDLRRDITFGTSVTAAHWDPETARWTVTTDAGETVDARFLVMATGCLSVDKAPEVPGTERFAGPVVHTGRWPHEGVDVTGKRVAVIGTGSSGIQSIPHLARDAAELTVFQRTPNFSIPARNRPLGAEEVAAFKARYRDYRAAARTSMVGIPRTPPTRSALEVDADERTRAFEDAWESGLLFALSGSFTDIRTNLDANVFAADFVREKIREKVDDPVAAASLQPWSHPYATKRPCMDSGYYETFNAEHVHLVDVRETPLVEITESGVRTSEGDHDVDVIVFATGFDAFTGALRRIDLRGRDGLTIQQKWADGPRSYLGIAVAGFPNLFTITGPGSPSVLSNMVVSIEQHVDWVSDLVADMDRRGIGVVEATSEAEDGWVAHVAEVGDRTLFPHADSWYMGANVPGKPRMLMAYVGGVGPYRQVCDDVAADGYRGFERHTAADRVG